MAHEIVVKLKADGTLGIRHFVTTTLAGCSVTTSEDVIEDNNCEGIKELLSKIVYKNKEKMEKEAVVAAARHVAAVMAKGSPKNLKFSSTIEPQGKVS